MGGIGSGSGLRWHTSREKQFVQEYRCLDVRLFPHRVMQQVPDTGKNLQLDGMDAILFRGRLEIYSPVVGFGGKSNRVRIPFDSTRAHYGNRRYWFLCPGSSCGRRCGKLYLYRTSEGDPLFLCRKCLNLAYKSQNQTILERMIAKKGTILHRLGAESCNLLDCDKPKWMHWRTFNEQRLKASHLENTVVDMIWPQHEHIPEIPLYS